MQWSGSWYVTQYLDAVEWALVPIGSYLDVVEWALVRLAQYIKTAEWAMVCTLMKWSGPWYVP
jgi:hypothetical protein